MMFSKKRQKPVLIEPSVISNDMFDDYLVESHYGEFDVQLTADSENDFPTIAHGYPITGFKDLDLDKNYRA